MWTAIGSSTQSRVRQNNRKRRPTGVSHSNQPHASFQHGSFGDSRPSITRAGSYSPTAGHHAGGEHALVGSNIAYQHAIQHGAQRKLKFLFVCYPAHWLRGCERSNVALRRGKCLRRFTGRVYLFTKYFTHCTHRSSTQCFGCELAPIATSAWQNHQ